MNFDKSGIYTVKRQKKLLITVGTNLFIAEFLLIGFLVVIIKSSTSRIIHSYRSEDFLEKINVLPVAPNSIILFVIILIGIMIISSILRWAFLRKKTIALILLTIVDFSICTLLNYLLNTGIPEIYFTALVLLLIFIPTRKIQFSLFIIILASYTVTDYRIISTFLNIFSIYNYIEIYSQKTIFILLLIKNFLSVWVLISFISFLFIEFRSKSDEADYIRLLNFKLRKTAAELKIALNKVNKYAEIAEEATRTEERNRMAREIHDIIGHSLTGIQLGLSASMELIGKDNEILKNQLIKIRTLSEKGLQEVKFSINELQPNVLKENSLLEAIIKLSDDIESMTGIEVNLDAEEFTEPLGLPLKETAYRIIQESITNVLRHSQASKIDIALEKGSQYLKFSIEDNGQGSENFKEGVGLTSIRKRVSMANGSLRIVNIPNGGFKIKCSIPLQNGDKE